MNDNDFKKIKTIIQEEISGSEKRLEGKIAGTGQSLEKRLGDRITQLSTDIGDLINNNIVPLIETKADKTDIDRLERKIDKLVDSNLDHGSRIRAIEQVPIIAQQLRIKKPK